MTFHMLDSHDTIVKESVRSFKEGALMPHGFDLKYCAVTDAPYWIFKGPGVPPSPPPDGTVLKGNVVWFARVPDPIVQAALH